MGVCACRGLHRLQSSWDFISALWVLKYLSKGQPRTLKITARGTLRRDWFGDFLTVWWYLSCTGQRADFQCCIMGIRQRWSDGVRKNKVEEGSKARGHLDSTGKAKAVCSKNICAHLGGRREGSYKAPWAPVKWATCSCGFCNQRDLISSYMEGSVPRATSRERPSILKSGLKQLFKFWLISSKTFFCSADLSPHVFPIPSRILPTLCLGKPGMVLMGSFMLLTWVSLQSLCPVQLEEQALQNYATGESRRNRPFSPTYCRCLPEIASVFSFFFSFNFSFYKNFIHTPN